MRRARSCAVLIGDAEIAGVDLDVDGSGLALIENRVLQGAALKKSAHVGEFRGHGFSHLSM